MRISLIVVALVIALWSREASGQSIVQKIDWQAKAFESYLSQPPHSVPGLDLNNRTVPGLDPNNRRKKPPKPDWPIGSRAAAVPPFVLDCAQRDTRVSSNAASDLRRM
jgi:hypothetical protein